MSRKLLYTSFMLSLSLFACFAVNAAEYHINLYGSHSQAKYWKETLPEFLKSQGCADQDNLSAGNEMEVDNDTHDRDASISVCKGDVAVPGFGTGAGINGDTVYFRYTSNSSIDGIYAVIADPGQDPDACGPAQRLQANAAGADLQGYPNTGNSIPTLSCQDVQVGVSDVGADAHRLISRGNLYGHRGGAYVDIDAVLYHDNQDPETIGYQVDRPIVVPYSFYANNDPVTPVPFNNINRMIAMQVFNGQIRNWNLFDDDFPSLPTILCLPHAGAGSSATFNAGIMRGDTVFMTTEMDPDHFLVQIGAGPVIWFNKGTTDVMRCIGENPGAIGFAEADACIDGCGDKYGHVKRLSYGGVQANNASIRKGQYVYWSRHWMYSNETGMTDTFIDALAAYAESEANLPITKSDYWITEEVMEVRKAHDDLYPRRK